MSSITTYSDESSVSAAIRGYGHIEGLITLCLENNMPVDSDETVSSFRTINDDVKQQLRQAPPLFSITPPALADPVIIDSGQNNVDLALQQGGSVECLIDLLRLNGLSVNDDLTPGALAKLNGLTILDSDVVKSYKGTSHKVNTGALEEPEPPPVEDTYNFTASLFDRTGLGATWSVAIGNGVDSPHVINLEGSEDGAVSEEYEAPVGSTALTITKLSEGSAIGGRTVIIILVDGFFNNAFYFFTSGQIIDPIIYDPAYMGNGEMEVLIYEGVNEVAYDYTSNQTGIWEVLYTAPPAFSESFSFFGTGNIIGRLLDFIEEGNDVTSRVRRTTNATGTVNISWRRNGSEVGFATIDPGDPVDVSFVYADIIPEDALNVYITETL